MQMADWSRETFIAERNYKPLTVEVTAYPGGIAMSVGSTMFRFSRHPGGGWDLECQGDVSEFEPMLPRRVK